MREREEFVPGRRYIIGVQPLGPQVVEFLGWVPFWPKKVRVRNPITRRVAWVDADRLRPVASRALPLEQYANTGSWP